jgi:DNA-binding NtrC family response regulator
VRRTILVVDDDPATLDLLALALEEEGYESRRCSDGMAALEAVAEHQIDLVLTDVVLPHLDGISLVHELRARGHLMPVIIISGMLDSVTLPNTPFLSKPFDLTHLLGLVARMLAPES